ncbi:hypothetical protein LWF15_25640 [Kineosporia rhizophila]|uniref:hypothetical protein n=1 Tax=Kineosporia TaxID=49184 RepID=UPI000AE8134B|nr:MULTISPECIES: hypothetical protein [Kineosporia]MCE0538887.1 hypothetical protein [Kineosporia rhizophila]GLY17983.1 hypothetical protein Kisp01_49970 [Kineosporia sp. NBRC 101677]
MFSLTGLEIAFFAITFAGIAVALVVLAKGQQIRVGLAVVLAAVLIPVLGPLFAIGYGVKLMLAARSTPEGSGPAA